MNKDELQQCKNYFSIAGIVKGLENPSKNQGFEIGTIKNGLSKGKQYKSIKFKVQTSPENTIPVECFGMELDNAYFYSKTLKKTIKAPWDKRNSLSKEGYLLIKPSFDLVQELHDELRDGESVTITGEIDYQEYKVNDEVKKNTKFIIKSVKKATHEIDFEHPEFKEKNKFNQDLVVDDISVDGDSIFINGLIIDFKKEIKTACFEVDTKKVHKLFTKKVMSLKFGDFMRVNGIINYKVIQEEVDGEWGTIFINDYKKSLEVLSVDEKSFEQGKYKQADLYGEDESDEFEEQFDDNELPFLID